MRGLRAEPLQDTKESFIYALLTIDLISNQVDYTPFSLQSIIMGTLSCEIIIKNIQY